MYSRTDVNLYTCLYTYMFIHVSVPMTITQPQPLASAAFKYILEVFAVQADIVQMV